MDVIGQWAPDSLGLRKTVGTSKIAAPVIPLRPISPQGGGRERTNDRQVLAAILYLNPGRLFVVELRAAMFGVTRPTPHRRFVECTRAALSERQHPR
jgi:hypothetical protein